MKLILTDHLKSRLKLRNISEKTIESVFKNIQELYWDSLRKHHVVISQVTYEGKLRKMLAAYDKITVDEFEVITIHPIKDAEIKQRLTTGRWTDEQNKD